MREQRVVDQGLVVPAPGLVHHALEVVEHGIVQANRDLRLPGLGPHDWPALRAREIDLAILFSGALAHIAPPGVDSPSTPRSAGCDPAPGVYRQPPADSRCRSAPTSRTVARPRRRDPPVSKRARLPRPIPPRRG